jgi:hypothetical protein
MAPRGGLSNKSKVRYGGIRGAGSAVKEQTLRVNRTPAQRAAARKEYGRGLACDERYVYLSNKNIPVALKMSNSLDIIISG